MLSQLLLSVILLCVSMSKSLHKTRSLAHLQFRSVLLPLLHHTGTSAATATITCYHRPDDNQRTTAKTLT